ncbi:MAG: hypothetical protein AB9866_13395 [Syntrophobacteraceae bacterium]
MKGFLLLFPFLACFFLSAGADGFEGHILFQNEDLVLRGEVQLEAEAKYLGQIYPEAKAGLEKVLDLPLLMKPTVLLVRNQELFERLGGGPFVSAFAVPSEHLIVLHLSPVTSRSPVLNDVFKHELCHLLLHDHIRGQNIPKWLDEGICQWVSGTIGEFLAGDRATISRIETAYRLIPLRQLALTFPKDKDLLLLAYKESQDFVGYVASHYGVESIREILKHLKRGDHVDQAIIGVLHKSFAEVQEEWIADMKSRSEWFIWVSLNLYEILFTAAAVLTILAAVRLRLRRAKYVDEEEE